MNLASKGEVWKIMDCNGIFGEEQRNVDQLILCCVLFLFLDMTQIKEIDSFKEDGLL